jgi:hypothetical protein
LAASSPCEPLAQQVHSHTSQLHWPLSQQHVPSPQQTSQAQAGLPAAARLGAANMPEITKNIASVSTDNKLPKNTLRFIFRSKKTQSNF